MIPAVILAAGRSTRMGRPKALLPVSESDTFLTWILRSFGAANVDDLVVVIGHEADAIVESVTRAGLSPRFVVNRDYDEGQLSSVVAGVRAIDHPGVNAMLLTLVDVPFVSAGTVRSVVARYRAVRAPIVRPVKDTRHGHPVLIDRSLFDALISADPQNGAKPIVRANVSLEGDVPIDDEGAYLDIDTPEEYERAVGQFGQRH
jgi:molybdenum cofactor cytidylyltransferase